LEDGNTISVSAGFRARLHMSIWIWSWTRWSKLNGAMPWWINLSISWRWVFLAMTAALHLHLVLVNVAPSFIIAVLEKTKKVEKHPKSARVSLQI